MASPWSSAGSQVVPHGSLIFAYRHIRTNQVVYSLTRSLRNNDALKQLPNLGKKSKPPALRKDLWTPLCQITFPRADMGLSSFRKLRELRRLHETAYDREIITNRKEGHVHYGQLLPRKERARVLQDQKANAVADIAAVLEIQQTPPTSEELDRGKMRAFNIKRRVWDSSLGHDRYFVNKRKFAPHNQWGSDATDWKGMSGGVVIRWANIIDAEHAEKWPGSVVHDDLDVERYTAAWPLPEEGGVSIGDEVGEAEASGVSQ